MPAFWTVAVSALAPRVRVQLPTRATPFASVTVDPPWMLPPPWMTVNVTPFPAIGAPFPSRSTTAGGWFTANPVSPVWPSPANAATLDNEPAATAVAAKLAGLPLIPVPTTAALIALVPVPEPSVQTVAACPCASVVDVAGATLPPPCVTVQATSTPAIGCATASGTWTTDTVTLSLSGVEEPCALANTFVVPTASALTCPVASTFATVPLPTLHVTLGFRIVSPRWSSTTAVRVRAPPIAPKLTVPGSTSIAIGTGTNGSVPLQANAPRASAKGIVRRSNMGLLAKGISMQRRVSHHSQQVTTQSGGRVMPVTITPRSSFTLCAGLAIVACGRTPDIRPLRLGTTTTVQQSGMLAVAESLWHGVPLATVIGPSGQILRSAEAGDLDVVLTHAPALEAKFLGNATAVERCPFVTSRFVVVGPAADPAGVRGARDAADALRRIAARGATFVSRGDSSGTHEREVALWRAAALAPWEGPRRRSWYVESGTDQTTTLRLADERRAYALADLPTLATLRDLELQPVFR